MKINTMKKRFFLYLVNHVYAGTHHFEKKRKLLNSIGYEISEGVKVVGPITCTGHLKVGRGCWIGTNLTIHGNGTVVIQENCDIAPDVTFLTGGHQIGSSSRRAGDGEKYYIEIGKGSWIGARTTLLGNVIVGDGCVVAACSCVNRNIEKNLLVGGVPIRQIRRLTDES